MFRTRIVAAVCVISIISTCGFGKTIFVDANGPCNPGSGTSTDPFRRIQDAIDAAQDGNIIEIRPGIYTGWGNYDLDPNGKSITICSINPEDPNTVASTIIDPNGEGGGFYLHSGENADCILSGLTIRNACAVVSYNGAGIYCYNSSPTVRNCIIRDGYAKGSGGGICCYYSNATVINCTIADNIADSYGGGVSCISSASLILGCTISGNTGGREGGGLDSGDSDPNIFNCVIIDNYAPVGGGINCYYPGVAHVVNCTLAANSAASFGGAIYCRVEGKAIIENSILWANSAGIGMQLALKDEGAASVTYCDVQDGQADVYDPCEQLVWGSGNIDSDPCFVRIGYWNDNGTPADMNDDFWVEGDYHLKSQVGRWDANERRWTKDDVTSPCIDVGDPNSDWSSEPWPNGKRINMGAYGGTNQASMSGSPGDFNIDGVVNFEDFCEIAGKWRLKGEFFEDLNSNGVVDAADLGLFTDTWLWRRK